MSRANDVIPNVDKLQRVGVCSETKTNTLGAYSGPQLLYPSHSSVPLLGCSSLERSQIVSARARHRCGFLRVSPQRQFDMSRHQDHKHTSSGQCRRAHAGPSSPNLARAGIYNVHLQCPRRQRELGAAAGASADAKENATVDSNQCVLSSPTPTPEISTTQNLKGLARELVALCVR